VPLPALTLATHAQELQLHLPPALAILALALALALVPRAWHPAPDLTGRFQVTVVMSTMVRAVCHSTIVVVAVVAMVEIVVRRFGQRRFGCMLL
jgi:hypothetical protein